MAVARRQAEKATSRWLQAAASRMAAGQETTGSPSPLSSSFQVRHSNSLAVKSSIAAKGPGGRSSVSGIVATVFGATGFLGRYVVQQLARSGSQVFVPYRCLEDGYRHLKVCGDLGQVVPIPLDVRDEGSVARAMAKSNVVVNLIGRDNETRNFTYEDTNIKAAELIARLASEHGGIARLIHLSCLGAALDSPSKQLVTKALGEAAVLAEYPGATILRPAVLAGVEDRFFNAWALLAKKLPAVPVFDGGRTLIQPVYVADVASAVTAAINDDGSSVGKTYELGGPEVLPVIDWLHRMFETIRETPRIVDIPMPIAKLLATPRELLLHRLPVPVVSPTMLTMDYLNSLERDTVVSPDALNFSDLGVVPRPLTGISTEFLYAYRSGGPQYGETVGERVSGAGF